MGTAHRASSAACRARHQHRAGGDRRPAARRGLPRVPRPPDHVGGSSRTAPAGWPTHLVAAGLGCPRRARGAGRPRERPGPPRHLPAERQRVPRVHGRRVEGPGRAVQRQLPLRRRRAALPAAPTPAPPAIVVHSRFAPTLAEVLPALPRLRVDPPGRRRQRPRSAARRPAGTRTCWPRSSPERPPVDVEPRRPLHPLHRRHHGDAQGRDVAQRRRHDRVLQRFADRAHRSRTSSPRPTSGSGR